ncbi:MAG: peptidoglycan editing factor PgeF [Candidatus Nanopelagicales bacterium]
MWSGTFTATSGSARSGFTADWYFTDRRGGSSQGAYESLNLAAHVGDSPESVGANLDAIATTARVSRSTLAVIKAEHGANVHEVNKDSITESPFADGLITTTPELALVALAADCAPVVLADVENQVVGAVHCGWRGVVAGVVPATVERMVRSGAHAPSISAVVGPAICPNCYAVDSDCAAAVADVSPTSVSQDSAGQWRVDVAAAVMASLQDLGVDAERIHECTFTNRELFSFRRNRVTGRQGAVIVMRTAGSQA